MKNCVLICPECSSVVETPYPEAMIWERCPVCRHHEWEEGDLMMAGAAQTRQDHDKQAQRSAHTN